MLSIRSAAIRYILLPCLFSMLAFPACYAARQAKENSEYRGNQERLEHLLLRNSYLRAWQLLRDNTLYPERLKGWSHWQHRFDGRLKCKKDLEEAVGLMLGDIHDEYTYFRDMDETRTASKSDEENLVVTSKMLAHKCSYLTIKNFTSTRTADELEAALEHASEAEAYIIDLRGNRGGYVEQALACFELLVEDGKFVSMIGREDGKPYKEELFLEASAVRRELNGVIYKEPRRKNLCAQKPMIVLIDRDTRSAAEMLAGALKDTKKAILVGNRSFGKGIVQSTWYLEPGCSLRIAMAKYYLPSSRDINGIGLSPDLLVQFEGEPEKGHEQSSLSESELASINRVFPAYFSKSASD